MGNTHNRDKNLRFCEKELGLDVLFKEWEEIMLGDEVKEDVDTEGEREESVSERCPYVEVKVGELKLSALVDSGSEITVVSEKVWESFKEAWIHVEKIPVANVVITTALGKNSKRLRSQIWLDFIIGGATINHIFYVVPGLSHGVILGADFCREVSASINFEQGELSFRHPAQGHRISTELSGQREIEYRGSNRVDLVVSDETGYGDSVKKVISKLDKQGDLSVATLKSFEETLNEARETFRPSIGKIKGVKYQFKMKTVQEYFYKSYPIPFKKQTAVEQEIRDMESQGIIERSRSPYINPLVAVTKKDGSVRLCIDARHLNQHLVNHRDSFLTVDDIFQYCHGMKVYSSVDLRSAFLQVELNEDSRKYTAFQFKNMTYQFCRVPFGTKVSLAALAESLHKVVGDLEFVKVYVDDILIISKTQEEHLRHLKTLFDRFHQNDITVNLEKSQFFCRELDFVGHKITRRGIEPQGDKLVRIRHFPTPRNQKELRAFLGLTNYYSKFTKRYSHVTAELGHLLKGKASWKWGEKEEGVFREVKRLFLETVVLQFPNFEQPFHLFTDSSGYALGAALCQYDSENELRVIYFASKCLKAAEKNYTTTELEILSVVWAFKKFHRYLAGNQTIVHSDHKALIYLNKCKDTTARLRRWVLFLPQYDYTITHIPGNKNSVADLLSRTLFEGGDHPQHGKQYNVRRTFRNEEGLFFKQLRGKIKNQLPHDSFYQEVIKQEAKKPGKKRVYREEQGLAWLVTKGTRKLYLPRGLQNTFIKKVHTFYAHVGITKTTHLIREDFYIPRLGRLVARVVGACPTCQKRKFHNQRLYAEQRSIEVEGRGKLVSCDFLGPLCGSVGGVKYIFVIIDNFTKFVRLYTLKSITTVSALKCLEKYISEVQKPERILTDHGVQFTSYKWKERLNELGIKHTLTAIRHPCSNLSERTNRDIGNFLRVLLGNVHTGWAKEIKRIENATNDTYHDTIEISPRVAQFGVWPERPWGTLIGGEKKTLSVAEYGELENNIKNNIREKGKTRRERFNMNHKLVRLNTGDKVVIRSNQIPLNTNKQVGKLLPLYEGPFLLGHDFQSGSFEVLHLDGRLKGKYHTNLMDKYREAKVWENEND